MEEHERRVWPEQLRLEGHEAGAGGGGVHQPTPQCRRRLRRLRTSGAAGSQAFSSHCQAINVYSTGRATTHLVHMAPAQPHIGLPQLVHGAAAVPEGVQRLLEGRRHPQARETVQRGVRRLARQRLHELPLRQDVF